MKAARGGARTAGLGGRCGGLALGCRQGRRRGEQWRSDGRERAQGRGGRSARAAGSYVARQSGEGGVDRALVREQAGVLRGELSVVGRRVGGAYRGQARVDRRIARTR